MSNNEGRFQFGENWKDFVMRKFSLDRLESAKAKLLSSLRIDSLKGLSFLDIGCGSGLHSLAAIKAGARRVVSFDYDLRSVETSEFLRKLYSPDSDWTIIQGSVLDRDFVSSLGFFDVVYSWGVLHHTGNVWKALRNAARAIDANGVLFIALYSHTVYENGQLDGAPSPEQWINMKRRYNDAGGLQKKFMEYKHVWNTFLRPQYMNPLQLYRNYRKFKELEKDYLQSRGMELWTDVRDWLGGWPMEFVNEIELQKFAGTRLGLQIVEMYGGEGNTEFILVPEKSKNWWSSIFQQQNRLQLDRNFDHVAGNAYMVRLPHLESLADNNLGGQKSPIRLWENDIMLTLAHCGHNAIQTYGRGRYSHFGQNILFSATDNTDPNSNRRIYSVTY